MVKVRKEIKGNVYGHLLALGEFKRENGRIRELCRCLKCGYEHYVDRPQLLLCRCGCRKCSHYKHGLSHGRLYSIYKGIKQRCENLKNKGYELYGARGIKCLWKTFEEFERDMGEEYNIHVNKYGERQTTIDRIDVNGDYCKENCRWATITEQNNNTRRNTGIYRFIEENGIPLNKVLYRHYTKGLTLEQIKTKFK